MTAKLKNPSLIEHKNIKYIVIEFSSSSNTPLNFQNTLRWSAIHNCPIWRFLKVAVASLVIFRQGRHLLLLAEERVKLAPTVQAPRVALRQAPSQWDCPLVEDKVHVLGPPTGGQVPRPVGGERLRRLDNLDVETGPEGGQVGDGKVVGAGVGGVGEELGELL